MAIQAELPGVPIQVEQAPVDTQPSAGFPGAGPSAVQPTKVTATLSLRVGSLADASVLQRPSALRALEAALRRTLDLVAEDRLVIDAADIVEVPNRRLANSGTSASGGSSWEVRVRFTITPHNVARVMATESKLQGLTAATSSGTAGYGQAVSQQSLATALQQELASRAIEVQVEVTGMIVQEISSAELDQQGPAAARVPQIAGQIGGEMSGRSPGAGQREAAASDGSALSLALPILGGLIALGLLTVVLAYVAVRQGLVGTGGFAQGFTKPTRVANVSGAGAMVQRSGSGCQTHVVNVAAGSSSSVAMHGRAGGSATGSGKIAWAPSAASASDPQKEEDERAATPGSSCSTAEPSSLGSRHSTDQVETPLDLVDGIDSGSDAGSQAQASLRAMLDGPRHAACLDDEVTSICTDDAVPSVTVASTANSSRACTPGALSLS